MRICIGYKDFMGLCTNEALENELYCRRCKELIEKEVNLISLSSRPGVIEKTDLELIEKKFDELKNLIINFLKKVKNQ